MRAAPELQRHPWVIVCFFGASAGFWLALWTSLEGWYVPFGISALGSAAGVAGILLWLRLTSMPLPKLGDYLTLVKTITKLRA